MRLVSSAHLLITLERFLASVDRTIMKVGAANDPCGQIHVHAVYLRQPQFQFYHCSGFIVHYFMSIIPILSSTSNVLKEIHFSTRMSQPELNLENDYPNKTGHNLETNSLISILYKVSDSA